METRRDFWVGLFVLTALGVITGTLLVTSGLGDVRYDLYMRTASAQDLTSDTRVFLQGLEIGRVRQVNPVQDSATGTLTFVTRLSINQRFPDGTEVTLPLGTSALIAQTSPIAAPVIQIETPRNARLSAYLLPGDTIPSTRTVSAMDRLGDVAEQVSGEVESALGETRRLLASTIQTVAATDSLLATTAPLVERSLTQLAASLERTDRMLGSLEPRVGPVVDSIALTLAETRQVLQRLDELAGTAGSMAAENRESIRATVENLRRSSIIMDHFVEQVSRRPTRMLTGVRPPPLADSAGPRP